MTRFFKKLLTLTLLAISATSCSLALLSDESEKLDGDLKIVVTGVASDVISNTPLTGIKITFSAYKENSISILPLASQTVYTNSDGIYTIQAEGFSEAITCTITAESIEQDEVQYEEITSKIVVTWSGDSFDEETGTFFVNDCNFQLKKKE